MEFIISILNIFFIPLSIAVAIESLLYLLYYLFKKDERNIIKYLKWLIISFAIYVSFNLGYEIGANYSFSEGLYRFIRSSGDALNYAFYGIIYYLLLHAPFLLYFHFKKRRDLYDVTMKKMFYLMGILIVVSVGFYILSKSAF